MNSKNICLFCLIIILSLILSSAGFAAGVRPMILNFEMEPGVSREFEFKLMPGSEREDFELSLYHPTQNIDGSLSYNIGDPEQNIYLNWIELEKNEVIVPAGQETIVKGTINIPYNAAGSHTAVIMIEPAENQSVNNLTNLNFMVRYALRININIKRPGQRARAEITEFNIEKNDKGDPQLFANIKNISPLHFNAQAEAILRDVNNRLIERVNIKSESAIRANNISTRLYRNSEVKFKGELSQPLYPAEYNLQIHLKFADDRQLIERKTIILEEELRKSGPRRYISYEPEMISKKLRAGSPVTQIIDINNLYNENIRVEVNKKEVVDNFDYSVFNVGEIQLRGGEEFIIEKLNSERLVFIFRSPRDAVERGYYGELELEVFNQNDDILETKNIGLEMIIGEDWNYDVEIANFNYINEEGIQTFTFDLKNQSQVHIIPESLIILKNNQDQIMKTINLNFGDELSKLLPEKTIKMTGKTTQIEAGTYNAEIVISHQNQEIKTIEQTVTVE